MSEMLTLPTKKRFRDARGRFRRKTREDMSDYERLIYDSSIIMMRKYAEKLLEPNPLWENLMARPVDNDGLKIGSTLRIRIPMDYKSRDKE